MATAKKAVAKKSAASKDVKNAEKSASDILSEGLENTENPEGSTEETPEESPVKKEVTPTINKKFSKLADYKNKIGFKEAKYKEQEWINMSPAFKESANLPGIPVGHVSMVYGKSDTGKSTAALELAAYALKQDILPILIITENKFSEERAVKMGIDLEGCIIHKGIRTIEEGCNKIKQYLDDQEDGKLQSDIVFIWDSLGATPTEAELSRREDESEGGAMMQAAKVIKEKFQRYLAFRINGTRAENYPYNATLFVVNQGYQSPPNINMGKRNTTIEPYGGDGLYLACTVVIRMGGIMTRSSKVDAQKNGAKVVFAVKSGFVVEKNHISNTSAKGNIICTDHGFISDSNEAIAAYKKEYAADWNLEFDKFWDKVSID